MPVRLSELLKKYWKDTPWISSTFFGDLLWMTAASASVLLANLLTFQSYNGLNAWFEIITISSIFAVVVFILAAPFAVTGRTGKALWAMAAGYIGSDLSGVGQDHLVIASVLIGLFCFLVHRTSFKIIAVAFAVVCAGSLFIKEKPFIQEASNGPPPKSTKRPVLHIILDEHGPEHSFEGFATWSRAYSRHFRTVNSLPEMLDDYLLTSKKNGYDVTVWESEFAQFCPQWAKCNRYWEGRAALAGSFRDRVELLGLQFIGTTGFLREQLPISKIAHSPPLNSMLLMDKMRESISNLKSGQLLVWHVLLPHYPYAFDEQCVARPFREWAYRKSGPIAQRHRGYEMQRTCIDETINTMLPDDAIVIIHSDHGTRIVDDDPNLMGDIAQSEWEAGFRSLFAIRLFDQDMISDQVSVSSLLNEFAQSDFSELPDGKRETVFLDGRNWVPEAEVDIPDIRSNQRP